CDCGNCATGRGPASPRAHLRPRARSMRRHRRPGKPGPTTWSPCRRRFGSCSRTSRTSPVRRTAGPRAGRVRPTRRGWPSSRRNSKRNNENWPSSRGAS
ncbi:MAG: hypothetical protein AVDCRST_MAG49-4664, partial [uncultured Thermomicrobiales bacterium]